MASLTKSASLTSLSSQRGRFGLSRPWPLPQTHVISLSQSDYWKAHGLSCKHWPLSHTISISHTDRPLSHRLASLAKSASLASPTKSCDLLIDYWLLIGSWDRPCAREAMCKRGYVQSPTDQPLSIDRSASLAKSASLTQIGLSRKIGLSCFSH